MDQSGLRIRAASTSDARRWDAYVAAHPLGSPYHSYAWRSAMERAYRLKAPYLLAEDPTGSLRGVLPVAEVPGLFGAGHLCSLPYCDRGEPLADSEDLCARMVATLQSQWERPYTLRATLDPRDEPLDDEALGAMAPGHKVRLVRALPDSSEALLASFKSKHRSQIRKAKKNGLTATIGNSPEQLSAFYAVYCVNMRDLGSPPHSYQWFSAVAESFAERCLIGVVHCGTRAVGAGIVLISGSRACIPWASTLREFNHLAPNMLLYWALLERVTDAGCNRFDFGRSTVGEGTYRFKTQWGAQPVALSWRQLPVAEGGGRGYADTPEDGPGASGGSAGIRRAIEAIWRRLPVAASAAIGARLRRYIDL